MSYNRLHWLVGPGQLVSLVLFQVQKLSSEAENLRFSKSNQVIQLYWLVGPGQLVSTMNMSSRLVELARKLARGVQRVNTPKDLLFSPIYVLPRSIQYRLIELLTIIRDTV